MFPGVLEHHIVNTTGFSQSRSQMSVGGTFLHCATCTFLAVNSDSCLTLHQSTNQDDSRKHGWTSTSYSSEHLTAEQFREGVGMQ